jgi:uncharacterized protein YbjT (DUF2867 family)
MFTQPYLAQQRGAVPAVRTGTILVTGATGTVGSEVVRHLAAAGERPHALVRDVEHARGRWGEQVEPVAGDLDRPEAIEAALTGVDRLFLLTRQTSRQPDQERDVIRAAARAHVQRIVKLSVFRADEHSPLQIARQHREAERALEQSGLAYTILRPVFFMQNLVTMLRDTAIYTAAQQGRVAMIDARDIASAAVAALTGHGHEARTYTLTGPEALSFDEVADILSQQTGRQIRHVRVSATDVRNALRNIGTEAWFADDMAHLHDMLAAGYENVVTQDVQTVTGKTPHTLARFARDFAGAFTGPEGGR